MEATSSTPAQGGSGKINSQETKETTGATASSTAISSVSPTIQLSQAESLSPQPTDTELVERKPERLPLKQSQPSGPDTVDTTSEPLSKSQKKRRRKKHKQKDSAESLSSASTQTSSEHEASRSEPKTVEATTIPDIEKTVMTLLPSITSGSGDYLLPELKLQIASIAKSIFDPTADFSRQVFELHKKGLLGVEYGDATVLHDCFMKVLEQIKPIPDDSPVMAEKKQALRKTLYITTKETYDANLHHYLNGKLLAKYIVSLGWFCACTADTDKAALEAAQMTMVAAPDANLPFGKTIARKALGFVNATLKETHDLDPEFRVVTATRAVTHYIQFNHYPPELWEVITREKTAAQQAGIPPEKLQLYWHGYQVLAQVYSNKKAKKGHHEQAALYNNHALKALELGIRHGSSVAYWDLGKVKLGIHLFLKDHRLTNAQNKDLCDCFQAENHFRTCSQLTLPYPVISEDIKKMHDIEACILQGISGVPPEILADCALDRLLGGFILKKNKATAMNLLNLLPDFQTLKSQAERLLKSTPVPTAGVLRERIKAPPKRCPVTAKMMFFAGIEAQQNQQSKQAKIYFTAAALGGFAGGVTKLAYLASESKPQDALLELASEMGDISAWQAMGDMHIGNLQLIQAQSCYQKAIDYYQELGFHDEASQLEELVALMMDPKDDSSDSSRRESRSSPGAIPVTSKPPSLKSAEDKPDSLSVTLVAQTKQEITQQPDTPAPVSAGDIHSKVVSTHTSPKTSASDKTTDSVLPAVRVSVTRSLPSTHITGRFSKWAKEMMSMQNERLKLLRGHLNIKDCTTDVRALVNDATLNPFIRQYKNRFLQFFPAQVFTYSTWLALRENMDDRRSALFCNTAGVERKHAEVNMLEYLEPRLKQGGIYSIEILITRNPCSDPSAGAGGCWHKLSELVTQYPDIQWNIRFIIPSGRHRYPRETSRHETVQAVLPFNRRKKCPSDWSRSTGPLTPLQEQVQESLSIPNLSYCVVPSYDPDGLADYYDNDGVDKFDDTQFRFNPHYPERKP